jgi:hypothetical protein
VFRVHPDLGFRRGITVQHETGGMHGLWGQGRGSAVGDWQTYPDPCLHAVSGSLMGLLAIRLSAMKHLEEVLVPGSANSTRGCAPSRWLWAKQLSWLETARSFHTSWEKVCQAVEYVVQWGLEHRQLGPIRAIGVDEIAYGRGHHYLTLVYQIEAGCVRPLWVGKERTEESFEKFLHPDRQGTGREDRIRLFGHVETLLEIDRQTLHERTQHSGSLPRRGEDESGH